MIDVQHPPFVPCRGLASGHLQTLAATYARPRLPYRATQHVVQLPDEDAVVLHDDCPPQWQDGDRIVLLVHGVAGCHGSPYLVRTARKLNDRGLRTFRMDLRGMGAGSRLATRPGHAGRSGDVAAAVDWLADYAPRCPMTLIGYSMGGNITLKLLGEVGDALSQVVDSSFAIAPPIDLVRCARSLNQGLQRIYSRSLTRMLLASLRDRPDVMAQLASPLAKLPTSLWDFDDQITAPLSGYPNAEVYYTESSAAPLLSRIRIPTLILAAADDPLIPVAMFDDASWSEQVQVQITSSGGHVGYYGRRGIDPDRWWLDWRVTDWVSALPAVLAE